MLEPSRTPPREPAPPRRRLRERWRALVLTPFPRARTTAVAVAALLTFPSLFFGFFADDYLQLAVLERAVPTTSSRFDLFRFASGDASEVGRVWVAHGPFPWWTLPDLKLAFFRPLASLLAAFDHALFGRFAPAYHAHSLLWFLALVWAFGGLLQRVLPGPVGALALMVFAIDDAHWMPAAWWANRNSVVSALFGVLALRAHLRWREDGWRPGLPASLLAWVLSLAGGEAGFSAMAYVAGYELVAGSGTRSRRALALLPAAVAGAAYLAVYKGLGYGAYHSGSYIDPLAEPLAYVAALAVRLPGLVEGLLGGIPADLWLTEPRARPWLVALGVLFVWITARLLRDAWPELEPEVRRAVAWLGAGCGLSLLPQAATFPTSRLLLLPTLGGCVVVAAFLHRWFAAWEGTLLDGGPGARRRRILCGGMVRIHTVYAPLLLVSMITVLAAAIAEGGPRYLATDFDETRFAEQRVVLVTSPDPMAAFYPPVVRKLNGRPLPKAWWPLSLAPYDHRLVRVDERTLDLEVVGGRMMETEFEVLVRHPDHPLRAGDRFALAGMDAEVLAVDDRGPTRVRFRFDRPLEDPSLLFLAWQGGYLRRVALPAPGESVVVPFEKITFLG